MIDDPYKVLGIPESASEEEIKGAYRALVKKYHPDLHPNDPTAEVKMKQINEAYDMLKNPDKYRARREQEERRQEQQASYSGYSQSGYGQYQSSQSRGYQTYGGWTSDFGGFDFDDIFGFGQTRYNTTPQPQAGDSYELAQAIRLIQNARYYEAIDILSRIVSAYRNDRYYYVSAAAYKGAGELTRAQDMIERAIQMNTSNQVYRQLRQEIILKSRSETGAYSTGMNVSPFRFMWKIFIGIMLFRLIMYILQMLIYGFRFGY